MPTTFQLTGDSRWGKGGELFELYDLKLNECEGDRVIYEDAGIDAPVLDAMPIENVQSAAPVKVLSEKSQVDLKKMIEDFKNCQRRSDIVFFLAV